MTDAELIPKLIIRERCGCNELYNRYKDKVFNICYKYLENTEDAEEITNDVLLAAIESIHTVRCDSGLLTWIFSIAKNKCQDEIKKINAECRIPPGKRYKLMISLI